MRVYSIKYKKYINTIPPARVEDTFSRGPFTRKAGEYEPRLFKTEGEAKEKAEEIVKDKGIDSSSYEVVSMYIDESDALFYLFDMAFGVFPDFRKCVKVTPKDLACEL